MKFNNGPIRHHQSADRHGRSDALDAVRAEAAGRGDDEAGTVLRTTKRKRRNKKVKIERTWAMPNMWTFLIPPFKKLLEEELTQGMWVDPFAGKNSPATMTNDLNGDLPANYHLDALAFLSGLPTHYADGVLYDPPYSFTQAAQCYAGYGKDKLEIGVGNMRYWSGCKNELARIIKPGGKAICFGWNSGGLGKNRGFVMAKLLLCAHGGGRNDTICTVEVKR